VLANRGPAGWAARSTGGQVGGTLTHKKTSPSANALPTSSAAAAEDLPSCAPPVLLPAQLLSSPSAQQSEIAKALALLIFCRGRGSSFPKLHLPDSGKGKCALGKLLAAGQHLLPAPLSDCRKTTTCCSNCAVVFYDRLHGCCAGWSGEATGNRWQAQHRCLRATATAVCTSTSAQHDQQWHAPSGPQQLMHNAEGMKGVFTIASMQ